MNIIAQCCGITIMLLLLYFYHSQKKLQLYTQKAFMGIWNASMLSIIFDVASVVAIHNLYKTNLFATEVICKLYLTSIVWMALMALRYVCIDALMQKIINKSWLLPLYLAGIIDTIVVFALPIEVYHQGYVVYTYGFSVIFVYAIAVVIITIMAFLIGRYRKVIDSRRWRGVVTWIAIWVAAAVVQFFFNQLLIVSFATTLGILVVFLLMENPSVNLDRDTGLFNLNAFFQYMRQTQITKNEQSILCISYDNNSHGSVSYEVEREIYRQLTEFMADIPRSTVFRSSTTEFLLVFDEEEYAEAAIKLIEKRFEKPWGGSYRTLTYDWYYLETTRSVERAADILPIIQYARQNRSEIVSHEGLRISDDVVIDMYRERDCENDIIMALVEDRVEVFYQPIYSTKDSCFTCAEALVRIRKEDGSIFPPGEFIPVAEKRGLIIKLGERVFEKVCQLIVERNPSQYGLKYVEVNLSVIQCAYEKLAEDFIAIMRKYKVDPKYIVLEITESASVRDREILLENMQKLKDVGVRFALDDFGTGQSNLNYIVDMPVDVVKFDSSMTNAYFENGTAKYVMDSAMQMIQGMDLEIVSEGIEEKEQYKVIEDIGIDYVQGYYFSKPVESDQFIDFIKENMKSANNMS